MSAGSARAPGAAVLVGYGSVGRFLGQVLAERYEKLAIIARSDETRARAAEAYPRVTIARSLEELDAVGWDWADSLAVIATWGPSHADYFEGFAQRGVRHVLCEKPLADSVSRASDMVARAKDLGVALGTHQQRAYSGLVPGLRRLALELDLGDPVSLWVHAGAVGLVTMGVHYMGFACDLFAAGPDSVVSTAKGDPINPRSPDLLYYGGTAIWRFGNGREAVFSFSNRSSAAATVAMLYRDAVATLTLEDSVLVEHRDRGQITADPRVTRTGDPVEVLYDGPIPGIAVSPAPTLAVLEEVERGEVATFPPELALRAVEACIGALESGASGRTVQLPIEPSSEIGQRRWPIS